MEEGTDEKKKWYLLRNFSVKHRFTITNPHTGEESWHIFLSPLNVLFGALALVVVMFVVVATIVAYTPMLDMIPGYPGNKSRKLLIENIQKLDSLQGRLELWEAYRQNIGLIMDGKTPITRQEFLSDSMQKNLSKNPRILPNAADSALRTQMEAASGPYSLNAAIAAGNSRQYSSPDIFPPTRGVVTGAFNAREGNLGVSIASLANQPVLAVFDGTVIFTGWTPDHGHIVQVQHPSNMVSVYKNLTRVIRKSGDIVKAGDVLGFSGTDEGGNNLNVYYELWYNGVPVDPENYITF